MIRAFAHVHPEVDDRGNLRVNHTFPAGGRYFLYADYKPAGGETSVARANVGVQGDAVPAPAVAPDVPGRVSADGLLVDVSVEPAGLGHGNHGDRRHAGIERRIRFALHDDAGEPVAGLERYMGAAGHLVLISGEDYHYIHAHPEDADVGDAHIGTFHTSFPSPGIYRGWAQFKTGGRLHTVPFTVEAGE